MALDESQPLTHRISRVEDRERLLEEALAHAAEREEKYRALDEETTRAWWKLPTAFLGFALATYLMAFPPVWLAGEPPPMLTPGELDRGLRASMWIQAAQIEAYRVRTGIVPRTLADAGGAQPGVRFVRSNNRVYQLVVGREDGSVLLYDSAHPAAGFKAAALPFLPPDPGDQR